MVNKAPNGLSDLNQLLQFSKATEIEVLGRKLAVTFPDTTLAPEVPSGISQRRELTSDVSTVEGQPRRPSLLGDVAKLASGTAVAQSVGLLAAPLIARLFSPDAFGGLALFAAISGTISVIACWRYELAIIIPEKDHDAGVLVCLSLIMVLLSTTIAGCFLILFAGRLWVWVNAPALRANSWLITANVFVTGTWAVLHAWNTRKRKFDRLTVMQVTTRVVITLSQLLCGILGFVSTTVLITTTIVGTSVSALILGIVSWREDLPAFSAGLSLPRLLSFLKRYRCFPKYNISSTLLNVISGHLPAVLLSSFFSVVTAGEWALGNRLLRVPGILIGSNFEYAFRPRAAEAKLAGTLGNAVENALVHLIKLSALPCLMLAVIGKPLFVLALGERWAEAGVYSQILSCWLFVWFISSPLNTVFTVLEEQSLELRYQTMNFVSRLVALLIGGLLGNARIAVALFTLAGIVVYGSYCTTIIRKAGAISVNVLRGCAPTIAIAVPAALAVALIRYWFASSVITVVSAACFCGLYFLKLVHTDPDAGRLMSVVRNKFWSTVS